jgi:two-component system response regulator HydG
MKRILIADDDLDICLLLSRFLAKNGFDVTQAHSGRSALNLVQERKFELILCDFRLGDLDGLEMLAAFNEFAPDVPVIIITGYSDIKTAVNVIKAGAFDYVTKPLIPDEILLTIGKALNGQAEEKKETGKGTAARGAPPEAPDSEFVIGESREAKELYRQIDLVAPTNYSVIIYGESGSGKEAVARSIHLKSPRKNQPFVALDCGAISRELAGSELFGHEKGAFTGALSQKVGHFEMANGGTLFLDEVANLPYEVQTSLLRVVQERKLKRIGGNKEIDLDVRIVIASNENLAEAYKKGLFREDLYHRFNEFSIHVPPLRERGKDIMVFAEHFLREAAHELQKPIRNFDEEVTQCFMAYNWPGNIREMKNVIKRATLLSDGHTIQARSLPVEISNYAKFMLLNGSAPGERAQGKSHNLKEVALEAEYETILKVLKEVNFNKSKAAKILNIDRKTLYNKMKAYKL